MNLSEYVRSVLLNYPGIVESSDKIHIDFMGMHPTQYAVRSEPVDPVIKAYKYGESLRRFVFVLEGNFDRLTDTDRDTNTTVFEDLTLWLDTESRFNRLPPMTDGARALKIKTAGSVYLERIPDNDEAGIYMMQIELQYHQKARNR